MYHVMAIYTCVIRNLYYGVHIVWMEFNLANFDKFKFHQSLTFIHKALAHIKVCPTHKFANHQIKTLPAIPLWVLYLFFKICATNVFLVGICIPLYAINFLLEQIN